MVKKIRFTIDPLGEVKLDVEGAIGSECDRLTEAFEQKLGFVASKERKDSYFSNTESTNQETQVGGSDE